MPLHSLDSISSPKSKRQVAVTRNRRGTFGLDRPLSFDKDAARARLTRWLACVLPDACVLHATPDEGAVRVADVTVLLQSGRCIFFDLAPQRGRAPRGMSAFADFCDAARIPYARVRHIEDARAALRRFSIAIREVA